MLPLNDDEELFFKRIYSLKDNAINNYKVSMLKFLDLRQQEIIKYVIGNNVFIYFNGGYDDAEYKKCIISPFELEEPDFKLDLLKLEYNKKYLTLNHRKVLACLMELGIKREVIGDILFDGDTCFIMVSNEMTDYLIQSLKLISHVPVELKKYDGEVSNIINFEEHKCFVSSMRLDAIISGIYNIARSASQELIKGECVKVNQVLIKNNSHETNPGDIISVRGKGRFKIVEVLGHSRGDKIVLKLAKYI